MCGGPPCENGNINFNRTPEEVAQGEDSPPSEIPKENLGGLFEADHAVEELIEKIQEGVMSLNDAREALGLRRVEDADILSRLEQTDREWFDNLRLEHLSTRRERSRWERG